MPVYSVKYMKKDSKGYRSYIWITETIKADTVLEALSKVDAKGALKISTVREIR